jgi:hypothetical protein
MLYNVLKPEYSAHDSKGTFVAVDWKIVKKIEAGNAHEALRKAKALGIPCPVIEDAEK